MAERTGTSNVPAKGFCRLCSQDSSYLSVDKDAGKHVCNPHPVELANRSVLGSVKMNMFHLLFPSNGMKMSALPYKIYDRNARPPDETGERVAVTVQTFRTDILRRYEVTSDLTLKGYYLKGDFNDPDKTLIIYAEIDIGKTLYIELERYSDTEEGSSYHIKGNTTMKYLYHKPRPSS